MTDIKRTVRAAPEGGRTNMRLVFKSPMSRTELRALNAWFAFAGFLTVQAEIADDRLAFLVYDDNDDTDVIVEAVESFVAAKLEAS